MEPGFGSRKGIGGIIMSWIEELSIERRTQYANGIIVQTDDCKRISEFFSFMKKQHPKPIVMRIKNNQTGNWIKENYFILDGWEGLCEYKNNNSIWSLVTIADAKKYGGEFRPLLTAVGTQLEKGNSVVVIQNMLTSDKYINNALRSWSTSDILRRKNSTVIVFVEDMNMFPENVWSKMKIIDVPKSEASERSDIIESQQKVMGLTSDSMLNEDELQSAVRVTAGMNLDQVDAAVVESLIRHTKLKIGSLAHSKNEMLGKNPALDIIQRPEFGFEAIGGYDTLKERIRNDVILPLKHPEIAKEYDMSPPRGMILFGPPGTGKTVMTKAMSRELNMSVLVLRPENFMSKYVGESEKGLKNVFKIADSMAPAIIMCDELDRLSKRASSGGSDGGAQVHREIFSMMLEKLGDERRKWFFVGCTNRLEDIDEAMRRTGRIDTLAPVPFPDEKAREKIFHIHSKVKRKLPLDKNINFRELASNAYTYMWSGSDIEELVKRTAKEVMKTSIKNGKIRKIGMDDFYKMVDTFNVDSTANEILQEHIKEQAQKLTNDKRLMDVFEEAQMVDEGSRGEKAKEILNSNSLADYDEGEV
jgi:ATP-dependent 26S proteasome regulatory subunit